MEEKDIVDVSLDWLVERNLHPTSELSPLNAIELIERNGYYVLMRRISRRTGLTEGFALYEIKEGSVLVLLRSWKSISIAYAAFAAFVNKSPNNFETDDYMIKYDDKFKEVPK